MSKYTNIAVWRRSLEPKICDECGRKYKPKSAGQLYCPKCKKTAYRKLQKRYLAKKKYRERVGRKNIGRGWEEKI